MIPTDLLSQIQILGNTPVSPDGSITLGMVLIFFLFIILLSKMLEKEK